jgi:hypothetical protein
MFAFAGLFASAAVAAPILGNYPDTPLPLSTNTTVTPDAAPTDAVSINVATSTDFKGTLVGDRATGVVRVTDAHPAGTYTVTVTAFDSGGATATKKFALTVTTPETCLPVSFAHAINYSFGHSPQALAVDDFNADGNQDLAVADYTSEGIAIFLLGDGADNFGAPVSFTAGNKPDSVAVGDFNGDGKQDLAATDSSSSSVVILLGDGAGNLGAPVSFTVGNNPTSVTVGDLNGDGQQDLVIPNEAQKSVSILLRCCPTD